MDSFYLKEELPFLGLKQYGENVLISRKSSIYSAKNVLIGDNVRIDDFCIISGNITIGSNVHISAYCALYGSQGITLKDYTGLSSKTIIYSAIDDFSGDYLVGPLYEREFTNLQGGCVIIEKYVQIGASCIVFPNLQIGEGVAVGAMSLVKETLEPWSIYVGIPARKIKKRSKKLLQFIKE